MSTSMPPPPSPLAHRRSKRLVTSSSLSLSPECVPRKMSLSKGATFHQSSSPSDDDPVLSIPHLPRRSPTASQSMLASWLSDKKDIAQSLADFEQTFSGARGKRRSTHRQSAQDFEQQVRAHRASLPIDEALGSSVGSPASDKGLSQTFERALDLVSDKDSGLGSSLPEDEEAVRDSIRVAETNTPSKPVTQPPSARQRAPPTRIPAVTASIAPPTRTARRHPPLSSFGRKTINKHILGPILREDRFQDFHDLVTSLGSTQNKAVRCLRDLEQSLIFQPLVRTLTAATSLTSDNDKSLAISQTLYRTFGEFTVQLVVDTYSQLSEADQRRTSDRPYDSGYFLDLVQQVGRLAAQVQRNNEEAGNTEDDNMAYSPEDEVTLEGGLGATGDHAELVRWKNGKGISLRTGLPYEATPGIKREASSLLDDDVSRSMARRKKGYIPEIVEMKCSDKSCDKIFTRKCDLAKHEKTHSRPFKCPFPGCKYAELGLPTDKERERHINDKHDPNPHYYRCEFCEFKTKRESNCKQHQEKKHNWTYSRAKGKDKTNTNPKMTPAQTPQTPSMEYASSMQSPAMSLQSSNWDDTRSMADSVAASTHMTPYEQPMNTFESYAQTPAFSNPLFPRDGQQMYSTGYENFGGYQQNTYVSPTNTTPMTPNNMMGTPITPAYSNITGQSPFLANMDISNDCGNNQPYNAALPTPDSFLQPHSRNPSISHQSPMCEPGDDFNFSDPIIAGGATIPGNDFTLFRGESTSPFSNPAAASATLFPADFAALDNHPIFDEAFMEDESSFVDFDAMTN